MEEFEKLKEIDWKASGFGRMLRIKPVLLIIGYTWEGYKNKPAFGKVELRLEDNSIVVEKEFSAKIIEQVMTKIEVWEKNIIKRILAILKENKY